MPLTNAQDYPLWLNALGFLTAATVVWGAGTRLTHYLDGIAGQTRLGQAFVGMLLLGGITSLPEVANAITSSWTGNPQLAINNLLGSAAINVVLLAVADAFIGRDAVTAVVVKPSTIMMGTLCMLVLMTVAAAVAIGDLLVFGVGTGAVVLCAMSIAFLWIASGYDRRAAWMIINLSLILLADAFFSGGPVINELGRFEIVSVMIEAPGQVRRTEGHGVRLLGEAKPGLVEGRDARMDLDTAEARRERAAWASAARPQGGVDVIADRFPNAKGAPDGVQDSGSESAKGIPIVSMRQPQ